MKQLVICSEGFQSQYDRVLNFGCIELGNEPVNYALIEYDDVVFDPEKYPHKVLVKKQAFSCNYRDMSIIKLSSNKVRNNKNLAMYPIGSEFSGVVVEVGSKVTKFKVGDRVLPDAFYTNMMKEEAYPGIPTNSASRELEIFHEHKLALLPNNMSFSVGAAFTIGAQTVYSMIERLDIKQNQRILITGIKSNTGLFAINALKGRGVEVSGVTRSKVDEVFFKDLGLDNVFTVTEEHFMANSEVQSYINSKGKFHSVIDPFSDSYLLQALDLLEFGGKYITCGISNQTTFKPLTINPTHEFGKIIMSNLTVIGNCLGTTENLIQALKDYSDNKLKVVIDNEIEEDVDLFMQKSFLSKDRMGKVVFKYSSN